MLNGDNERDERLFRLAKEAAIGEGFEHYTGCPNGNSSAPINECACDCYTRKWFELGRRAQQELFYGADRRGLQPC